MSANINDSNSKGARGIMFTITAKQNIVIRGFYILARRRNAVKVSIYTRSGSYSNTTYSVDGWQLIFQKRIQSQLFSNNYHLKLDDNQVKVPIRAGQTQSFYIFNSNGLTFKTGINEGGSYVEDAAIVMNEGRLTKTFFANATIGVGQFGGTVRYYMDRW